MKDLKRQLQQMQKREEKLQDQLTALRGGTGTAHSSPHVASSPSSSQLSRIHTKAGEWAWGAGLLYCTCMCIILWLTALNLSSGPFPVFQCQAHSMHFNATYTHSSISAHSRHFNAMYAHSSILAHSQYFNIMPNPRISMPAQFNTGTIPTFQCWLLFSVWRPSMLAATLYMYIGMTN